MPTISEVFVGDTVRQAHNKAREWADKHAVTLGVDPSEFNVRSYWQCAGGAAVVTVGDGF